LCTLSDPKELSQQLPVLVKLVVQHLPPELHCIQLIDALSWVTGSRLAAYLTEILPVLLRALEAEADLVSQVSSE
jgi:hypothetical protein